MAYLANNPKPKKQKSHHRYDSLPKALDKIVSDPNALNHDEDGTRDEFYIKSKIGQDNENYDSNKNKLSLRPKISNRKHQKSASISDIANKLGFHRKGSNDSIDEDTKTNEHSYSHSINMQRNLIRYNKKEQQDLITIQTNLKKWIGSVEFVILPDFLELMEKIAGHVSTQQATEMFNQMDPSNNGQIATSLLLHDEFLPRMILNLFKKEDDMASIRSRGNSMGSLPEDFGLEDDDISTDLEDMDKDEYITKIKTQKAEINRLNQWVQDYGQPAIDEANRLQMVLDEYERERSDKQSELKTYETRLSTMGDLKEKLINQQTQSNLLLKENDSLLLSVQESTKKHEIERKKYNEALREAKQYKKLAKELQEINDKYNQKNQILNEKQARLEEDNQNLRETLLAYETEKTEQFYEYNEQIQHLNDEMKNLQNDLEANRVHAQGHGVRFYVTDDEGNNSDGQYRKRRMTLRNQNSSDDNMNSMANEIDNSLTGRGRNRRDTIRGWYDAHMRKASHISLPNEDTLRNMPEDQEDENGPNHTIVVSFERQDSAQSAASTANTANTHNTANNGQPPLYNARSYEDPQLYKQLDVSHKQDSAPTSGIGQMGLSTPNIFGRTHDDIFEDALAQELKVELRKKLAAEFREDYELKLKQKDIEYQMKLHKDLKVANEEQRKEKERYEKRIDELNAKLTEYSKKNGNGKIDLVDDMSFDADEMVYLSGGDGGMTNFSSPISEYEINSDDEKEAFDQGIMDNDYNADYIIQQNGARHSRNNSGVNGDRTDNDDENKPLIDPKKKRFDDNQYAAQVLNNRDKKDKKKKKKKKRKKQGEGSSTQKDDKCFSCFGLFTGTGV